MNITMCCIDNFRGAHHGERIHTWIVYTIRSIKNIEIQFTGSSEIFTVVNWLFMVLSTSVSVSSTEPNIFTKAKLTVQTGILKYR